MNKNLPNIDKLFVKFLDNYQEDPSENSWEAIENELNKIDAAKYKSKYSLLKKAFICAVLVCTLLSVNYLLQPGIHNSFLKESERSKPLTNQVSTEKNSSESIIIKPSIEKLTNATKEKTELKNKKAIEIATIQLNKNNVFVMPWQLVTENHTGYKLCKTI